MITAKLLVRHPETSSIIITTNIIYGEISACYHQHHHHVYHERRVGEVIGDTTRGRFRGTRGHQTEGARLASVNQIFVMCVKIVRFQGPGLASVISFEIIYQDNKNLVLETTLFLYFI